MGMAAAALTGLYLTYSYGRGRREIEKVSPSNSNENLFVSLEMSTQHI